MRKFSESVLLLFGLSLLAACGGAGGGWGGGSQPTQFSVSGPASSGAGIPFTFTVTAVAAYGTVVTSYSGTVHFTSSDPAAVLPQNSTLMNGMGTFSATLNSGGLQTITAADTVSASLQGALTTTDVIGEFPVSSFGAKGDGTTDDTAAIQSALNAAGSAGGGSVVLGWARYYTTGQLVIPAGVVLSGAVEGPFFLPGHNPATNTFGPTLLITNTSGPFLTLQGMGSGVTDLLFHYPNQVPNTAAAPNVYPYTILVTAPGTKVVRSTVTNAYNFLDIESGRVLVSDVGIGSYHIGINIDHAYDHVTLRTIINHVYYDALGGPGFPAPIDNWVESNGIGLVAGRVDGLEISDFFVFVRAVGLTLADSPDASQNPRCGYGSGNNFHMEGLTYGFIVNASQSAGYKFANVVGLGDQPLQQSMVQIGTGGSLPPKIEINGGYNEVGPLPPPGPDAIFVYLLP